MNKCRKILTSAFLAAVVSLFLNFGVIAQGIDPEVSEDVGAVSETAELDSFVLLEGELVPDDGIDPLYISPVPLNRYNFLTKTVETSGGTAGSITIESGIYRVSRSPVTNVTQTSYGVYAEILDGASNVKADITIDVVYYSAFDSYPYHKSERTNALITEKIIYNSDINYVSATITVSSTEFGSVSWQLNSNVYLSKSSAFAIDTSRIPKGPNDSVTVSEKPSEIYAELVAEGAEAEFVLRSDDGSVNVLQWDEDGYITTILDGIETRLTKEEYLELNVVGLEIRRAGENTEQ